MNMLLTMEKIKSVTIKFKSIFLLLFFKILFIYFLERGEGREKKKERNINVQEKHQLVASCTPPTGDLAHNPGMCPDQNQTCDLSVCRTMPNPLSHTSQDLKVFLSGILFYNFQMGSGKSLKCIPYTSIMLVQNSYYVYQLNLSPALNFCYENDNTN
ncbi:hypothetical protein HJG60_010663 [Phyllostomus discolor]|uniref:Uncharacterized protein n=1 Tax=Phyllostomus discolor TaxID=89673 RepID=A0A834ALS2_9CHIR|nr:hypothetical protein HJG60_010663 [Phyllostomus discolor]